MPACRQAGRATRGGVFPLIGKKISHYNVTEKLGAGGMGEVYRATDTKLNRDVALKVLPEEFARDADRMARFKREAQVLASLNHPNIASIYGLEEADGVRCLVLELVEGPTLAERIAAGPLPVEEALGIARQIAEALEAAHEKGIIHRDLKPANVKVTPEGTVKVLDFGLAKALEDDPSSFDISESPTLSVAATQAGVILGTAAYMSPEQARGQAVDKRADIWAFGVVLFEMLTGRRAFTGETISDTLAAVLRAEVDWEAVPADMPASIRKLLRRCLTRERKQRLQAIGDARVELESPEPSDLAGVASSKPAPGRYAVSWAVAAMLIAVVVIAFAFLYFRQAPLELQGAKLQLLPPDGFEFGSIAVSPDGRGLAFTAVDSSGNAQLWLRPLNALTAQPLPETEGASYPFWSPDSRFIAFFADNKLKKIDASGGSPQTLCDLIDAKGGARGGSWSRSGVILFGVSAFHPAPLYQVSDKGGEPRPVTTLETFSNAAHHGWPSFMPDGRYFLYLAINEVDPDRTGIYLGSLDAPDARLLVRADTGAAYARDAAGGTGYVLFVRERTLMAQAFDPRRLEMTGDAVPIAERVGVDLSAQRSKFSASENGVLVYGAGSGTSQLLWFDRTGTPLGSLGPPGRDIDFRISPDGHRVAAQREVETGRAHIFLLELARGTSARFTFEPTYHAAPVWAPDGSRLTFFKVGDGRWSIWEKVSSGAGAQRLLLSTSNDLVPNDWSPDGKFLLYSERAPDTRADLWVLAARGVGSDQPRGTPFVRTQSDETFARFSPDGRWVVYQSNQTGRYEIYVRKFPADDSGPGGKLISTDGGIEPRWPRRGKEIFYIGSDNMLMAVDVRSGATIEVGVPRPLFPTRPVGVLRYDVTADGQRFLVATPTDEAVSAPVTVVLNWHEELRRRVPTGKN